MTMIKISYAEAIRLAIKESMEETNDLVALGQGLWSPFYVGSTMEKLEEIFGKERVIDTPVSENAVTSMALGVALAGGRCLIVHPRMDFMVLATDSLVNAIAKWRSALSREISLPITIRAIINRGGEQGAQHSQSLYSWFAHVPGLRVVVPSNAKDAYKLLKQSLLGIDPVIFVEDRWDYNSISEINLGESFPSIKEEQPEILLHGTDITIWGIGHTVNLALEAAKELGNLGISCEVIDQRILAPFTYNKVLESVQKTKRLLTVENAWPVASMSSEIVARVAREIGQKELLKIQSLHMLNATAPTSRALEKDYYVKAQDITAKVREMLP
jgi:pyruvate/2-oxoglutarate/acetoin dehydrogenase E1 component